MPFPPVVTGFTGLTQAARLTIEPNQGEQLLLAQTAGASTMSLATQPNAVGGATVGMHVHFYVIGNTGAGTITVAGTAPVTGSAVNSQTYHINPAPINNQGYSEFTTTEVFATINASGITLSAGLAGACTIIVFGCLASKFLIPYEADAEEHIGRFSPSDRRGILWHDFRVQQIHKWATLDKLDGVVYPDQLWLLYMLVTSNPAVTTVPASPSILLAATTKAATMTLSTPPVAPGMFLIFTPGSNSVTGTIGLNGKDIFSNTQTETVNVGANNNVVYSKFRYSSLNVPGLSQFTTTGLSSGATIAVTGVYAWTYTGTWDGLTNTTKSTATFEHFDGVQGIILPFTYLSDGTFTWEKEKEITFSGKGEAQDYLIVGDPNPTVYPSGTNPFATLAQPTAMPMAAWSSQFFIDTLPGVPFTTQDGSMRTFKVQIGTGLKPYFVGDGMQRWSSLTYGAEPDVTLDATLIYQNYQYYTQYFKQNAKFVLGATFNGTLLGNIGGTSYFENIQFTFPVRVDTFKPDRAKDPVEATLKLFNEYDFQALNFAFRMSMTCQVPPVYTA